MRNISYLPFILVLLFHISLSAQKRGLQDFYQLFQQGSYISALKIAQNLSPKEISSDKIYYLQGICLNKLQRFDSATDSFRKAFIHGSDAPDLFYEYGQASFAMNDYIEAKRSFYKVTLTNPTLTPASLYYLGHIAQTANDDETAIYYYRTLPYSAVSQKELIQNGQLQIVKILSKSTPDDEKEAPLYVASTLLPNLESAKALDPDSDMAQKIHTYHTELINQYDLNPLKLINGKLLPEKNWDISLRNTSVYDSNVIAEPEQVTAKAVHRGSIVSRTDFSLKKFWAIDRRYIITPKWRSTYTHHLINRTSEIRRNDAYSINPKLEGRIEHTLFEKPSSLTVKGEYTYSGKRINPEEKISYSGRTWNFSIGEKGKLWNKGETSLSLGYKDFIGTTKESSAQTYSFSLNQTLSLTPSGVLLLYANVDTIKTPYAPLNDQDSLTLRGDYIYPEIYQKWTLQGSMMVIITDTKKQRETRGRETAFTPGINLINNINSWLGLTIQYEFTKNLSKAKTTYAYNKHVVGAEIEVKL